MTGSQLEVEEESHAGRTGDSQELPVCGQAQATVVQRAAIASYADALRRKTRASTYSRAVIVTHNDMRRLRFRLHIVLV